MSANIYWEPVNKNPKSINTTTPQHFIETFDIPRTFGKKDIEFLQGYYKATKSKEVQQLIKAIERYGEIKVWDAY